MKKLFILINVLLIAFFAKAQYPTGRLYPVNQSIGADSTLVTSKGGLKGRLINWSFVDTTAANLQAIKNYAGAQIFTTSNNAIWVRNSTATAWILQISNININNFLDSSVTNVSINPDSTGIIICTGGSIPVCDTFLFAIDSITNVFILNDSTAIGCQEPRTTCVNGVCTTEQICDTIAININNPLFIFRNGLRKLNGQNIWEYGSEDPGDFSSSLIHNTIFQAGWYNLLIQGQMSGHEILSIKQNQWSSNSASIMSLNHNGAYDGVLPPAIDKDNLVNLYFNYFDPMYKSGAGGDSTGFMESSLGYAIMTNARGGGYQLYVDNSLSKQTGIFFHTLDTANTDAVTIFGQQTPATYPMSPTLDSNLYDQRIAVFKTNHQVQFPTYLTTSSYAGTAQGLIGFDASGNLITTAGGATTTTNIINDSTISVCTGTSCDTIVVSGASIQTVFVINDSTLLVCNTALTSCDTVNIPQPQQNFDRGFFDPNQASIGATVHNANTNDFYLLNVGSYITSFNSADTYDIIASNTSNTMFRLSNGWGAIMWDENGENFVQSNTPGIVLGLNSTSDSLIVNNLTNHTFQDRLLGQFSSSNRVGYVTIGTGLSLSAGVLSSTGIAAITADNGLTASTATNVQLGATASGANSPLLHNTYVNGSTFFLEVNGAKTGATTADGLFRVVNTSSGTISIYAENTSGLGVWGNSTGGTGVYGQTTDANGVYGAATTTGIGVFASSQSNYAVYGASGTTGIPLGGRTDNSSTNTVVTLLELYRNSSATTADGVGGNISYYITSDNGNKRLSNEIISKFTTDADPTRTSQLDITGVNSAATGTIASFYGSGVVGIGISSSYTATRLNVVDNAVGAASIVDITSTSTAAASNLQKVINVALSGANATATQTTYGIYSSNIHSGTTPTNYGVYGEINNSTFGAGVAGVGNGSLTGVSGTSSSGSGVFGSGSPGVYGSSTSGNAVQGITTSGLGGFFQAFPASTNTEVDVIQFSRGSTGSAGNGIGGRAAWLNEASDGSNYESAAISSTWTDVTLATRTGNLKFYTTLTATPTLTLTLSANGSALFRPITATAASAITPAEGMMLFVSSTDATFTSIGFWGYQNGAWHAF